MNIQKELTAVSQLSKKQQQIGLSLLTKVFKDVLKCTEQQKTKSININAVIQKTNCYNFVDILLLAGYYKINKGKQLKFNASKRNQLKCVLFEIKKYNLSMPSPSRTRNTLKSEYKHKMKQSKVSKIRSRTRSGITSYTKYKRQVPKTFGKYKLGNDIGRGASATIYQCTDLKSQVYAMKLFNKRKMDKDEIVAALSEIDILSSLPSHPNIIKLVDVVESDEFIAIILPYFESGSLLSFVRAFGVGQMSEIMVKAFITQILTALQCVHSHKIIHRDVKAANVLINNDGICKLTDFGISVDIDIEEKEGNEFGSADVEGSPFWMAPEVIEMGSLSTACDIWAVGATAIELFTGYPPYSTLNPMSALFRIVHDTHPKLPQNISDLFRDFLSECFYKNAKYRPTAYELLKHKWLKTIEFEQESFEY